MQNHPHQLYQIPVQVVHQQQCSPIISTVNHQPSSYEIKYYNQMEVQYRQQSQIYNNFTTQLLNQNNPTQPFNPQIIQGQQQQQPSFINQTVPQQQNHIQNIQFPQKHYQPQIEQPYIQNRAQNYCQKYNQRSISSEYDNCCPQSHPYNSRPQFQSSNEQTEEKFQPLSVLWKEDLDQKTKQFEQKQPQQLQQIQQASNPLKNQKFHKTQPQVKENQLQLLTLNYQNDYIYRGQGYEPDIREGDGTLTDQNENLVYAGQWKDNQQHGKGKLINVEPEEIEGPFDYQDFNEIKNGWSWYEGDFSKGNMHGEGTLQLTNEEFFKGRFVDGKIDGKGEFTTLNGQSFTGFWEKGVLTFVQG
ncbi:unnamed protein product (macronuclear) [Paramecium tetraurelia]|uniref:MORN repeat protein n=1 Tax=Paramecium tetraurelia TaxID=5888 RepID=A0C4R0_PARTE|nr:uncharacterized protein GSPATT00006276001 [Paramecium tetraurelia]CAK65777.1 unnamed protein product [Paramecium tetraurelia]|eukprot:XP_001433174.1 hypothetical protein (macronuclear) [Paramecium tetraurelia strain d4-2]